MRRTTVSLIALLLALLVATAYAQPLTIQTNQYTTSLYAQQQIDMLPGFEATATGFEAKIKLPEAQCGRWSDARLWTPYARAGTGTPRTGMIGIHTHVLPSGNVLSWEGHNDDVHMPGMGMSYAYGWNPNPNGQNAGQVYPNVYTELTTEASNIFCSGHAFLADGRLLVAGGHYSSGVVDRSAIPPSLSSSSNPVNVPGNPEFIPPTSPWPDLSSGNVNGYIGLRHANTFNYTGDGTAGSTYVWQAKSPMTYRRWYPTATTLSTGDALVVAGQRYGGPTTGNTTVQAEMPEVFDAAAGTWRSLTNATRRLPLYPWMFLAPDGRVFNAGPNERTGFLNTTGTGAWTDGPTHPTTTAPINNYEFYSRFYGTAVMYRPGKLLVLGGGPPTAQLIDLNAASPAWTSAAALTYPVRSHVNATLLADGTVLVTGGTRRTDSSNDIHAVLPAELWTPPAPGTTGGGTWATMNQMNVPRLYHSTAVLLPDATVLSAGGGQGGGFQDHPDYEIFTPPYLLKGFGRPQISACPQAAAYGQTFTVSSPDASAILNNGGRITLVRLSSVTHSFNMNQRFAELTPTASPGNASDLLLTVPNSPNLYPPGHYMLFLIAPDGTPSQASILAVNATGCANTLSIVQSVVTDSGCDKVIRLTVTGGTNASPYAWTVNGSSYGTGQYVDVAVNAYSAVVQAHVEQNTSCGANSTFTTYFPRCVYSARPATGKQ